MDFLQRNLFAQLRTDNFGTKEELEPMTVFKKKKIAQMMKNLNAVPAGAVLMNNSFLNRRLIKIQKEERHSIDTSIETLYLLRLLVSNINGILANGISIRGIIQLGQYLRTRGDKVDFIKLESWLRKLHIQRMAQLEGSVLITFFDFEKDEIPLYAEWKRRLQTHPTLPLLQHAGGKRHRVRTDCHWLCTYNRRHHAQEPQTKHALHNLCPH